METTPNPITTYTLRNLFQGRVTRSQWLIGKLYAILGVLVSFLVAAVFYGIVGVFTENETANFLTQFVLWPLFAFIGVVQISLDIRRLHDIGKSWQWALFSYVFLLALIPYLLVLALKPGVVGPNEYGNPIVERRSLRMIFNV